MLGHHDPNSLVAVHEISVEIGGTPSAVVAAKLELMFDDGRREEFTLEFETPLAFDTWRLRLSALQRHVGQ